MKKKLIPLLVVGAALIAGCNQDKNAGTTAATATPPIDKSQAIAVVNGQFIPQSALTALENEIAGRGHGQTFPKEKLIEELIQRELLVQDAMQKQLDKSPELLAQLEIAKKSLLTQADLQNFVKANPVTDAEIKAEYDSKVALEKGVEYKARHILVNTEEEAKKMIAELDKGADFAKLANQNSTDAKQSQNGGDLGWFSSAQMVAPFSAAVAALEDNKYTKEPVKTQFGFHVILREGSRPLTPPTLEAVKEQLTSFLQRKKVMDMLETLRKQAKVEILVPPTEAQPKAEAAPVATAPAPAPAAAEQPAKAEPAKAAEEKPAEPAKAAESPAPAKAEEPAKTAEPAPAAPATPKK